MSDDFPLDQSGARYDQWLATQRKAGLLEREQLLPVLHVPVPNRPPALMCSRMEMDDADRAELEGKAAALEPWGSYVIQLTDGFQTGYRPLFERMVYRSHLICNAVKELAGASFAETTVLDMACNHGYFGLQCVFDGAKQAHGVDLREVNIAKAELLKAHFGIQNASFAYGNAFDVSGQFDVVLNLGLLYHVTDPYALMAKTYECCDIFAVVDTITHLAPVSAFIQRTNKDAAHHAEGRFAVEYHPTYRALIDLMHAVGFRDLVEVQPQANEGRAEHPLYEACHRRCIIGFK